MGFNKMALFSNEQGECLSPISLYHSNRVSRGCVDACENRLLVSAFGLCVLAKIISRVNPVSGNDLVSFLYLIYIISFF